LQQQLKMLQHQSQELQQQSQELQQQQSALRFAAMQSDQKDPKDSSHSNKHGASEDGGQGQGQGQGRAPSTPQAANSAATQGQGQDSASVSFHSSITTFLPGHMGPMTTHMLLPRNKKEARGS
jgi:hypothetical protein